MKNTNFSFEVIDRTNITKSNIDHYIFNANVGTQIHSIINELMFKKGILTFLRINRYKDDRVVYTKYLGNINVTQKTILTAALKSLQ